MRVVCVNGVCIMGSRVRVPNTVAGNCSLSTWEAKKGRKIVSSRWSGIQSETLVHTQLPPQKEKEPLPSSDVSSGGLAGVFLS